MKTTSIIRTLAIALALGTGITFAEEEKDEKVAFATLPEAVQKTIQAQATAKSAVVGEVEKDAEHGKVSYEAEIVQKDGKKFEVKVAEDGSLIKVKAAEDEKEEKGGKGKDDDDDGDEAE